MSDAMFPLAKITADPAIQSRASLAEGTVAEYAEQYRAGAEMPPVTLFFDGSTHWLADGFHRAQAAKAAGLAEIAVDVHSGSLHDARMFSAGANIIHGLRRTNADKRRAVEMLLSDPECAGWSNEQIARHCQVSTFLVAEMREHLREIGDSSGSLISEKSEMNPGAPGTRTVTRGGVTYQMNVGKIGKRPAKITAPPAPKPWPEYERPSNAEGLLSCPFCGSLNITFAQGPDNGQVVLCPDDDCLAVGPRRETAEEALEAWNMRC